MRRFYCSYEGEHSQKDGLNMAGRIDRAKRGEWERERNQREPGGPGEI